ncbi:uncharacterized protein LOC120283989 [Dioscorea cayenensis subsp. rotundata]|uniref:Uncharacterized protein LOC120283989 n=1 Tax=Dioscorea cayennensis subsp. rotundata TaxID=55577 RepID=A0AB40D8S1_DIOCR|nr:uncharacterized protein LOC120283989 [Dioscorea cayenensis subsp. rotundata]
MKQLNPFIFCLVETRADNSRLDIFCSKLGQKWAWAAIAADGFSGGLIVIWQKQLGKVSPLARSRYVLHLVVTNVKNESWILSTVYNSNHYQVQTTVWYELSGIASLNLPWILIGDFNTIASLDEFQGGSRSYYRRKARVFSDFISVNNLFDVNYTGSRFTWCNNQYGVARKWARLDRCLINSCCAAHLDLLEAEALDILNGYDRVSSNYLNALYNKLAALYRQSSSKWAQRARHMWVLCGDQNTSFFHNIIRSRNHYNAISVITDTSGNCFTDQKDIETVFSNSFY